MSKTFIIAEIGINHNGDFKTVKKLINGAANAGCDAVKFQKRTIDIVYSPEELDKDRDSPWGKTQRGQKEKLEFGLKEYSEIDKYCKFIGSLIALLDQCHYFLVIKLWILKQFYKVLMRIKKTMRKGSERHY